MYFYVKKRRHGEEVGLEEKDSKTDQQLIIFFDEASALLKKGSFLYSNQFFHFKLTYFYKYTKKSVIPKI